MLDRIVASGLTGYAVWHACRARPEPQMRAIQRELLANQKRILELSEQGPEIIAAVRAAVNGAIGGKVGLGHGTPGYPGGTARY